MEIAKGNGESGTGSDRNMRLGRTIGDRDERSGTMKTGPGMVLLYRNTDTAELPQGDVRTTELSSDTLLRELMRPVSAYMYT